VPCALGYFLFVVPQIYISSPWIDPGTSWESLQGETFANYSAHVIRSFRFDLAWMWFLPFLFVMHVINFYTFKGKASEALVVAAVWSVCLGAVASFGGDARRRATLSLSFFLPYLVRFASLLSPRLRKCTSLIFLVCIVGCNIWLGTIFDGFGLESDTCYGPWVGYCQDPKLGSIDFTCVMWVGFNHYIVAGFSYSANHGAAQLPIQNALKGGALFLTSLFLLVFAASVPNPAGKEFFYIAAWVWSGSIRAAAHGMFPSCTPQDNVVEQHVHVSALYIYVAHFFFIDAGARIFIWNPGHECRAHVLDLNPEP
jgi:hypothetical protein